MKQLSKHYDVIVVGSGHAGSEAALASARAGCSTLVITPNMDRIGYMPCNPSIGGPAKSHIVAEIDALGGAMARVADLTAMQVRRLNTSKGPAVQAVRAQCDKSLYAMLMKEQLELQDNLDLIQDSASGLILDNVSASGPTTVAGVITAIAGPIPAQCVIVTAGTFLRAKMISGESSSSGGRAGDSADATLTGSLLDLGIKLRRFKTGTPPRIDSRTIETGEAEVQPGDDTPLWLSRDGELGRIYPVVLPPAPNGPFAYPERRGGRLQVPCFQTHTSEEAHQIIRDNLHRAPMYNGSIEGTGPRYCPSIEDKVGRFADKSSHPIFIEPEGWRSHEVYIQGLSTSLPPDVQQAILPSISGLRDARITRYGYAVEYDAVDPTELTHALESTRVSGLFLAGQINGTSGYEEAGGQGIVAGINAAARIRGLPPLQLRREESYIGVMIDDLVTLAFEEPYRMLTSRAEYRLLLRTDTADQRMNPHAADYDVTSEQRQQEIDQEQRLMDAMMSQLATVWLGDNPRHAAALGGEGLEPARRSMTGLDLARRPGVELTSVLRALTHLSLWNNEIPSERMARRTEIAIRYGAFIDKEQREAERQLAAQEQVIPPGLDFASVVGLRVEAAQRLNERPPFTIAQARRTPGVTPSDIGALLVHLRRTSSRQQPVAS
ncbi:MAG: tRNA uridine-5-carboxymethylaminomethyl(34) synthesis enzyme MnmG [Chloroflexia bacterium]|nr:tRNA uridine-5-carboxymethylaminomethyl(34) synthesis enzyme MnmG [Chloroflexia bacterium]